MPISCPGGKKPRYRVKGGKQRLAFCGKNVVEVKNLNSGKLKKVAKQRKSLGMN
jgi:hypothetical protein